MSFKQLLSRSIALKGGLLSLLFLFQGIPSEAAPEKLGWLTLTLGPSDSNRLYNSLTTAAQSNGFSTHNLSVQCQAHNCMIFINKEPANAKDQVFDGAQNSKILVINTKKDVSTIRKSFKSLPFQTIDSFKYTSPLNEKLFTIPHFKISCTLDSCEIVTHKK